MKTCKYIGLAGLAFIGVSSLLVAKSALAWQVFGGTLRP